MATTDHQDRFKRTFLLLLVLAVSAVFLFMIRNFVVALLMAAIFSGMARPLYRWLETRFKGRSGLAAGATLAILIVCVGVPVSIFFGIVVAQAAEVSQAARPWIESTFSQPGSLEEFLAGIPYVSQWLPDQAVVASKMGELAAAAGRYLADSAVDFTRGTANFFLMLFVMLYAMFFFLTGGQAILKRILYFVPLSSAVEEDLVDKFVSVTRAVLKGSLVIGLIQGALAGLSFWVVGIPAWAFWTTVMVVLSVVPAIGSALIWIPAVAYLAITGETGAAIGVGLWCGLVAGSVDNFLRPKLVGRDTKMPDLLVLVGTLGGIFLFGGLGFILGPIVVALFLAVWQLYGEVFADFLPEAEEGALKEVSNASGSGEA